MRLKRAFLFKNFLFVFFVMIFCEYLIYYLVIFQCSWPVLNTVYSDISKPVRAMILADTHLLGKRNGHWFDKLRREWQMHRAFQTAMTLHSPELVFVLGDLFDEGLWCSGVEFNEYIDRFHSLFSIPEDTKMYVAVGNHDIGFHYKTTPYLTERFVKGLNSPVVQIVSVRDNHFVLLNSMATEGDGCFLCHEAELALSNVSNLLQCMKGNKYCENYKHLSEYSRPILLQHFPLYRISDEMCTESDAAPLSERNVRFRERWDCLSRESTETLIEKLQPRVVLGGHTHHACYITHNIAASSNDDLKMVEYSVPSFSWRNRNDPSFMLGVFAPNEYKISKCRMPQENTVINIYMFCGVLWFLYVFFYIKRCKPHISTSRKMF